MKNEFIIFLIIMFIQFGLFVSFQLFYNKKQKESYMPKDNNHDEKISLLQITMTESNYQEIIYQLVKILYLFNILDLTYLFKKEYLDTLKYDDFDKLTNILNIASGYDSEYIFDFNNYIIKNRNIESIVLPSEEDFITKFSVSKNTLSTLLPFLTNKTISLRTYYNDHIVEFRKYLDRPKNIKIKDIIEIKDFITEEVCKNYTDLIKIKLNMTDNIINK